jgi:hypothetical protein
MPLKMSKKRKDRNRSNGQSSALAQKFNIWGTRRNRVQTLKVQEIDNGLNSPVLNLNNRNYKDVISDSSKDVVVEFYDQEVHTLDALCNVQNENFKVIDNICTGLGEGYKGVQDKIVIARCNVRNVNAHNVYCLPTIKIYPANSKLLPVEYIPQDYSHIEGYTKFIEEEGSHHVRYKFPEPVELQT